MASSWGIFSPGNYAGVDQGVDFRGGGAIPALDAATVTDVGRSPIVEGGSYPYVVYRLNTGPYKGSYVYTAENFQPVVKKGQTLRQGQAIGVAAGKYPYIEIGFNKTASGWDAVAPLGGATAAGAAMKKYIYGLIGTAAPVTIPDSVKSKFPLPPLTGPNTVTTPLGPVNVPGASDVKAVSQFLGELSSASFWIRALEIIGGGLILLLGLYLLAKSAGLGADLPPPPGASEGQIFDFQQPTYSRQTEGVRQDKVSHDVSEAGERRAARKRLAERAEPSDDVPF